MDRAIVVQGLGFGDEGKGAIVDFLCSRSDVSCVVRHNGGCQAQHNVVLEDGTHHCFSQYGSGTLRGIPTFLDRHMIIDIPALLAESQALARLAQPSVDTGGLTIHPDCLITTPYHRLLNIVEDQRNGHGSCGRGVGATRRMWSRTGDGLRVGDLASRRTLSRKMDWIYQWCLDQLLGDYTSVPEFTLPRIAPHDPEFRVMETFGRRYQTCWNDDPELNGTVVFEGAQGFGLDERYGTIPHTTYSDTTPALALGHIPPGTDTEIIGVTRTYETRHGNGPMFREHKTAAHPDTEYNRGGFAGLFRSGDLSEAAVRRAVHLCGVTSLAVTHTDFVPTPVWLPDIAPIGISSGGPTAVSMQHTPEALHLECPASV